MTDYAFGGCQIENLNEEVAKGGRAVSCFCDTVKSGMLGADIFSGGMPMKIEFWMQ